MEPAFDPYHIWLGIPKVDQPPHHYRLLGLAAFENSREVIEGAADRQMAYVRGQASGKHAAVTQKLLNEISAARVCLLNAEKKAAYDAELKQRLAPKTALPVAGAAKPIATAIPVAAPLQMAKPIAPAPIVPSPLASHDDADETEIECDSETETDIEPAVPIVIATSSASKRKARASNPYLVPAVSVVAVVVALGAMLWVLNQPADPTPLVAGTSGSRSTGEATSPVARTQATPLASSSGSRGSSPPSRDPAVTFPFPASTRSTTPSSGGPATTGISPFPAATRETTTTEPRRETKLDPPEVAGAGPHPDGGLPSGTAFDVFRLIDPDRDTIHGPAWTRHDGGLMSSKNIYDMLELPIDVPNEYRLRFTARIIGAPESQYSLRIGLVGAGPRTKFTAAVNLKGPEGRGYVGLETVDGKLFADNPSLRPGPAFVDSVPVQVCCSVQKRRVLITVNDEVCLDWSTNYENLGLQPGLPVKGAPLRCFFCTWKSSYEISAVTLESLDASAVMPVPAPPEIAKANKLIDELFAKPWAAARAMTERKQVVSSIISAAADPSLDPPTRYALLIRGKELACEALDPQTALAAIERLGQEFNIAKSAERVSVVENVAKVAGPADSSAMIELAFTVYDQTVYEEEYELADRCLKTALKFATKSSGDYLKSLCQRRREELTALEKASESAARAKMTLSATPDDPEANLEVGLYYAGLRDDWLKGLPYLMKAAETPLAELAAEDFADPKAATAQVKLGEAWEAYSQQAPPSLRTAALRRAASWYSRGQAGLASTLEQARVGKLLRALGVHNLTLAEQRQTWTFRKKTYLYVPKLVVWQEAQDWCLARGGNLVCIADRPESEMLARVADEYGEVHCLIGATDSAQEGKWQWVDGSRFNFTNWASQQPDNTGGQEHFASIHGSPEYQRKWNDAPYGWTGHFICQWVEEK